jgi:flavin reductase (DIM6/NTAB) family NADH-FMN oxidoreductase RutF
MPEPITVTNFSRLLHPYHTALVTCCDAGGNPNIITIAWLIPVSIHPPLLVISVRPERYSYKQILSNSEFVVNMATFEIAHQALYCGRKSGSEVNKFAATGLTPRPARHVHPPIIEECPAHIECRLQQDIEVGDHHLLVGEVLVAYAHPEALGVDGLYDLTRVHPLLHLGSNRFTTTRVETTEPTIG